MFDGFGVTQQRTCLSAVLGRERDDEAVTADAP